MIFLLREIIVLIAGLLSAWTDLKTGEIPDKITFTLIAIGLILNILEQQWLGIALSVGIFAVGYLLYYTGRLGGGDVKLFAGISMIMPFFQGTIFILPVLLYSALIAVVFLSVYYVVKLARLGKLKIKENLNGIFNALIVGIALIIYFWIMLNSGLFKFQNFLILSIPLFFALLFFAFEKSIRKNFFLKKIKLKDLEDDELIALEFLPEKLQKKLELRAKRIIDKKLKTELKKERIKEILVYRNLPRFAPFVFAGIILTITKPELIAGVFKAW